MIAFIEVVIIVAFILNNSACIIRIKNIKIRIKCICNILGWGSNPSLNFYWFVIYAKTMVYCLQ